MNDIQQLIKKDNQSGKYENIFPNSFTNAITDKDDGEKLSDILVK